MTRAAAFTYLLVLLTGLSCGRRAETMFVAQPSSYTGIDFVNHIEEDVDFNILSYEYLYNGGGVAAADLNNDGLTDLVFSGNMVRSRLYLNKGNFQFQDISDAAGFSDREKWKTGVVAADVNGDGLQDIYLCYSGPGGDAGRSNQLFINDGVKNGVPSFREAAREYGLDAPGTYSTTASFFDYDRDGDLDMFLVNHADMFFNPFFNTAKLRAKRHPKFGNRLYRNDDNHFADVSDSAGILGSGLNFGLSVSTSDINSDGWTDVYVTNDYDERDFLYLNNQDGTFREVLDKAAGHISEFAMGSDIADYNNDNLSDVIVLDMLPDDNHRQKLLKGADTYDKYTTRLKHGFHRQQMRNTLQLNNGVDSSGTPIFSEVGQIAGIYKTDWSWAPLLADFDNDGWKDLFVSNGIFKDITNLDFVKYTSGYSNKFEGDKGSKPEMWELIKQMPSTRLDNYFFKNNRDLTFSDVSGKWGSGKNRISNGAAYADLDNDGDLDMIVSCLNDEPYVLENSADSQLRNHFLRIALKGANKNTGGIGAVINVTSAGGRQTYEQYTSRGFQSSTDPVIHVGLGGDSIVSELEVRWPSGKVSRVNNIAVDTLLTISENGSTELHMAMKDSSAALLSDITKKSRLDFVHKQPPFVDFKIAPLLPFQLSKLGPVLAAGDVNGDGMNDVFIGTNTKNENRLYLQQADGKFIASTNQPWNERKDMTVADAVFNDFDDDDDVDLYLVAGGADYYSGAKNYQDQVYQNDGSGNFQLIKNALPAETLSGSCVAVADFNKDGLPDLFVGSQYNYGRFPEPAKSILLINKSAAGRILFEQDRSQTDTSLFSPGMVSDAECVDINRDGWTDLIVAGLFMPITIFQNEKGKLINRTVNYGLEHTNGWWCRIAAGDFDKDGYPDLVLGNMGKNSAFEASQEEPLTITYADFNGDGVIDPILSLYNHGISYPYFSRDELFEQMPSLQKKLGRYADYADATIEDLFEPEQLQRAKTISVKEVKSIVLMNTRNGKFLRKELPMQAQLSMANGILVDDFNGDDNDDLIIAGNFYPMRVQAGPMDASIGTLLLNDGRGNFSARVFNHTGICIGGDVRSLLSVSTGKNRIILSARADDALQVFQVNQSK